MLETTYLQILAEGIEESQLRAVQQALEQQPYSVNKNYPKRMIAFEDM